MSETYAAHAPLRPHHRRTDGEQVGWLVDDAHGTTALDLLQRVVVEGVDEWDATDALDERGLGWLQERWWVRLPPRLPDSPLPLSTGVPEPGWEWRPVVVTELSLAACLVRPAWPEEGEERATAVVPNPPGDLLREQPPR